MSEKYTNFTCAELQKDAVMYELIANAATNTKCTICGNTMLHLAFSSGNDSRIKRLVRINYRLLMVRNKRRQIPLHLAPPLQEGLDVLNNTQQRVQNRMILITDAKSRTVLHYAAKTKQTILHESACEYLQVVHKKFVVDLNRQDYKLRAPLHYATMVGNLNAIVLLTHIGARTSLRDSEGKTAFYWAVIKQHKDCVKYYTHWFPNLAQQPDNSGIPPLMAAVCLGNTKIVRAILYTGASIVMPKHLNANLLILACENDHCGVVRAILEKGASPNVGFGEDNSSATHYVLKHPNCCCECLTQLEKFGADFTQKNKAGNTAVHLAASQSKPEALKIVLKHLEDGELDEEMVFEKRVPRWIDVDDRNYKGETALCKAVESECLENVRLLLDAKASMDGWNHKRQTILHYLVMKPMRQDFQIACLNMLLEKGMLLSLGDFKDINNLTPKNYLKIWCDKSSPPNYKLYDEFESLLSRRYTRTCGKY